LTTMIHVRREKGRTTIHVVPKERKGSSVSLNSRLSRVIRRECRISENDDVKGTSIVVVTRR